MAGLSTGSTGLWSGLPSLLYTTGLTTSVGLNADTFSPLTLFSAGQQGAWYDPSDFLPNWRRNLLTYTEQFDNAAWVKDRVTVTANAIAAPDGTTTADKVLDTAAGSNTYRIYNSLTLSATSYTQTVYAKAAELSWCYIRIGNASRAWFDLANGVVGTVDTGLAASIQSAGNGWYRLTVTIATATAGAGFGLVGLTTGNNIEVYTATGGNGIYVWGAQLELGSTATSYQQIVTPEISYLTYQAQPVMFQNSNGSTPVTAVEQPVGLFLDKSKGLVLGRNLQSSGAISLVGSATAATYNTSTGAGSVTRVDATNQSFVTWTGLSSNTYKITIQNTGASNNINLRSGAHSGTIAIAILPGQAVTVYVVPTVNQISVTSGAATANFTLSSIQELPGNHASQGTDAARPVLSSRVNLLTYSEQFDNAAWAKTNSSITANAVAAPDGTITADKLVENVTASVGHTVGRTVTTSTGQPYLYSVYLRAAERTFAAVLLQGAQAVTIDLATGSVASVVGSPIDPQAENVGNGWWRLSFGVTAAGASIGIAIYLTTGASWASREYVGDGTSGIYVWGADLRATNDGVGIPTYQRIAAATDYDTVGFPLYLKFDGTDDSLATSSINFTSTDKVTVWAGVRKLSDAATGMLYELGNSSQNAFFLTVPQGAAATYGWSSKGSLSASVTSPASYAAPISNIVTGIGDIANDGCVIRVNGTQVGSAAADQGTGNFGNLPLYIGRRGGTTLPFNGRLYGLIVRGAQSTPAQITAAEIWMNQRTRAY